MVANVTEKGQRKGCCHYICSMGLNGKQWDAEFPSAAKQEEEFEAQKVDVPASARQAAEWRLLAKTQAARQKMDERVHDTESSQEAFADEELPEWCRQFIDGDECDNYAMEAEFARRRAAGTLGFELPTADAPAATQEPAPETQQPTPTPAPEPERFVENQKGISVYNNSADQAQGLAPRMSLATGDTIITTTEIGQDGIQVIGLAGSPEFIPGFVEAKDLDGETASTVTSEEAVVVGNERTPDRRLAAVEGPSAVMDFLPIVLSFLFFLVLARIVCVFNRRSKEQVKTAPTEDSKSMFININ